MFLDFKFSQSSTRYFAFPMSSISDRPCSVAHVGASCGGRLQKSPPEEMLNGPTG